MRTPDKIVLEHTGALGDFLLAWPAFLSLCRHFAGLPIAFAVSPSHAPWLLPLAAACDPGLRRDLDARYADEVWPASLQGSLIVRPGLAGSPWPEREGFWFLRGIESGRDLSPREMYRLALKRKGVPFASDFKETFQRLFGRHAPQGDTALLFPGAGHPDKAWALSRLECLASRLRTHDIRAVFVLGPVERERGFAPKDCEVVTPSSLQALSAALCAARFAVGPDSGPLHLAGMHGVPGVALFGPTSARQWGPLGLSVVTAGLDCAPCVAVTADAFAPDCPRPLPCLEGIGVEAVLAALARQQLIAGGV